MSQKTQKTLSDPDMQEDVPLGLAICPKCAHRVPDAIICAWCGHQLKSLRDIPEFRGSRSPASPRGTCSNNSD